jgi:hypothetical protein
MPQMKIQGKFYSPQVDQWLDQINQLTTLKCAELAQYKHFTEIVSGEKK